MNVAPGSGRRPRSPSPKRRRAAPSASTSTTTSGANRSLPSRSNTGVQRSPSPSTTSRLGSASCTSTRIGSRGRSLRVVGRRERQRALREPRPVGPVGGDRDRVASGSSVRPWSTRRTFPRATARLLHLAVVIEARQAERERQRVGWRPCDLDDGGIVERVDRLRDARQPDRVPVAWIGVGLLPGRRSEHLLEAAGRRRRRAAAARPSLSTSVARVLPAGRQHSASLQV